MKRDLMNLIDSQSDIEKLFHTVVGPYMPDTETIHDVQEFQDWLMELKLELQDIFDKQHDQFVLETINVCGKNMNGITDRRIFSEIVGRLKAIRKNIDKYYPDEKETVNEELVHVMGAEKKPLIFISHSSANKNQVKLLVDMMRAINMQSGDLFCSSLPGYDIPIDINIFDFLRKRFLEYNLHVIFIHSTDYYRSPISLNEMGAAWALKTKETSFLVPGFDFSEMKGVINGDRISIKLDNDVNEVKDKLNQFRRILVEEFNLSPVPDITWEEARDKFIEEINRSEA